MNNLIKVILRIMLNLIVLVVILYNIMLNLEVNIIDNSKSGINNNYIVIIDILGQRFNYEVKGE